MKEEYLKANRAAAELAFMLAQVSINLQYLDAAQRAQFEQQLVSINHDVQVLTRQVGQVNSSIIKTYENERL